MGHVCHVTTVPGPGQTKLSLSLITAAAAVFRIIVAEHVFRLHVVTGGVIVTLLDCQKHRPRNQIPSLSQPNSQNRERTARPSVQCCAACNDSATRVFTSQDTTFALLPPCRATITAAAWMIDGC